LRSAREDATAFAALYDRYEAAVVGSLKRSMPDPEVVADVTAEVFAAVLAAAS
jgi:DNA-directed RNA polymerase specialized sigma24 family protein